MAQLMPLPLTVSCSSKIQIGFTFVIQADPGSPGKRAVKCMCKSQCYTNPHVLCLLQTGMTVCCARTRTEC